MGLHHFALLPAMPLLSPVLGSTSILSGVGHPPSNRCVVVFNVALLCVSLIILSIFYCTYLPSIYLLEDSVCSNLLIFVFLLLKFVLFIYPGIFFLLLILTQGYVFYGF